MKEKFFKKRLDLQKNIITRQSQQIEMLKSQNENLKQQLKDKDKVINSVQLIEKEMMSDIQESKKTRNEYQSLVDELRKMKKIVNMTVYKGRWKLVKFLIK